MKQLMRLLKLGFRNKLFRVLPLVALGVAQVAAQTGPIPGTNPNAAAPAALNSPPTGPSLSLSPFYTETGLFYLSLDGMGTLSNSGSIRVLKPPGATVRRAFLLSATTGETEFLLSPGEILLAGSPVTWLTNIANNISSYNYLGEVTSIVQPLIDAAPAGTNSLVITEGADTLDIDGEILAVVFNDPNQTTENTIALLFGAQNTAGDTFSITFADPLNPADTNLVLDMSLGISYGYQTTTVTNQFSIVNVNGQRLTSSAGGQDDGQPANGGLITVGGIGDTDANPSPYAGVGPLGDRTDDELYNLVPFITNGTTTISVYTQNPSDDDNILFAGFFLKSATAIVNEGILLTPVSATNQLGMTHTLTADVLNSLGQPVSGVTVDFNVISGPNAGTNGSGVTGTNGITTFSYVGNTPGLDTIQASFFDTNTGNTVTSSPVLKLWVGQNGPDLYKYNLITGTNVSVGEEFSYQLSFDTFSNTVAAVDLQLVDQLPSQETFVSATTNGALSVTYNPINNTVTWNFGTFPPLTQGPTNFVTVILNSNAVANSTIVNNASLTSSNLSVVQTGDRNPSCPTCGNGVTVSSNSPPVIVVHTPVTVSNDFGVCEGTVTPSQVNNGSTSPQGGPLTFTLVPPSPYPVGSNSVWFVATDTNGLSASNLVTIIVVDAQPPTIICPPNLVVTNDGTCCDPAIVVLPAPTVTDNCPGVTFVSTRSDGLPLTSPYPVGFTTITCTATDASSNTASCSYTVEVTADRTIPSNFSGPPIPGNSTIWFSSILLPNLNGACTATIKVIHQSISSADFNLELPDAEILFVTNACPATTVFSNGMWITTVSSTYVGDVFLSGFAYQVPATGLPSGINPVTWAGTFIGDTTNVTANWRWAAADYTTFTSNYNAIGVKPVDGKLCTIYTNTDDAATPESYKSDISASFKGTGGATWTGTLSAVNTITACDTIPSSSPIPSVSVNIKFVNGMVQLTWPKGILQEAPEFSGPYTDVTSATSPYNVAPGPKKYYRVRMQ